MLDSAVPHISATIKPFWEKVIQDAVSSRDVRQFAILLDYIFDTTRLLQENASLATGFEILRFLTKVYIFQKKNDKMRFIVILDRFRSYFRQKCQFPEKWRFPEKRHFRSLIKANDFRITLVRIILHYGISWKAPELRSQIVDWILHTPNVINNDYQMIRSSVGSLLFAAVVWKSRSFSKYFFFQKLVFRDQWWIMFDQVFEDILISRTSS